MVAAMQPNWPRARKEAGKCDCDLSIVAREDDNDVVVVARRYRGCIGGHEQLSISATILRIWKRCKMEVLQHISDAEVPSNATGTSIQATERPDGRFSA